MSRKRITILGATGSIGRQTLEVVATQADHFVVVGLAAYQNASELAEQATRLGVKQCAVVDEAAAESLRRAAPGLRVHAGPEGLTQLVADTAPDLVVCAVSGGAGLASLAATLQNGVDVALANKEPLVIAGQFVTDLAKQSGARLLPVDSELSAIFQCLQGQPRHAVERLMLTASGGPFSRLSAAEFASITPEQALRHPTWRMGQKVTVDSATLANKGFEIYEARWLFDVPFERIEVVIHHQSIIHSLVEFRDHSVIAQLGWPDMRVPIQYALTYPERLENALPRLDLAQVASLTFAAPDLQRFPCLRLAREAADRGGGYPAVLSGADEAAVGLFLERRIGFMEIPMLVERVLDDFGGAVPVSLDEAMQIEEWARGHARSLATAS